MQRQLPNFFFASLLNSIDKLKEFRHENEELKSIISNLEESKSSYMEKLASAKRDVLEQEREITNLHNTVRTCLNLLTHIYIACVQFLVKRPSYLRCMFL